MGWGVYSPSALLGPLKKRASQLAAQSQGKRPPPGVQNGHHQHREHKEKAGWQRGRGRGWAGGGAGLSGGNVIWDSLKINPEGASAPAPTERCVRGKSKQAVQPSARVCQFVCMHVCLARKAVWLSVAGAYRTNTELID